MSNCHKEDADPDRLLSSDAAEEADDSDSGWSGPADADASEVDLEPDDYESKREKCLKQLIALEKQFHALREELYKERVQHLEKRHEELLSGTAADLRSRTEEIDRNGKKQANVAEKRLEFRKQTLSRVKEAADLAAERDRVNMAQIKYDEIKQRLLDKIEALHREKHEADVNLAFWMAKNELTKQSPGRRGKRGRPVTVSGAHLVYLLPEEDIEADWLAIKRASIDMQIRNAPKC